MLLIKLPQIDLVLPTDLACPIIGLDLETNLQIKADLVHLIGKVIPIDLVLPTELACLIIGLV